RPIPRRSRPGDPVGERVAEPDHRELHGRAHRVRRARPRGGGDRRQGRRPHQWTLGRQPPPAPDRPRGPHPRAHAGRRRLWPWGRARPGPHRARPRPRIHASIANEEGLTGPGQAYTQTPGARPSAPDVGRCEGSQEVPMNRLVRVALVLAAPLAVTIPPQAVEDVRGWRNTTWKMSQSEVKRSVGSLGLVVTPAPVSPALPTAVPFTTKVDIDGSEYDVA